MSLEEESFYVRVERISSKFDRFFRRGNESLAGGVGEAPPAFGVPAFSLEHWDIYDNDGESKKNRLHKLFY